MTEQENEAAPSETLESVKEEEPSEFGFYENLTKPMLLFLPCNKERAKATAWVQKLKDESVGPDKLRTDYLKLLIFVLQNRRLIGIFEDDPNIYTTLTDFNEFFNINDFAKCMVEKDFNIRKKKTQDEYDGVCEIARPTQYDYSSDLKEYVSAQDIPNFGLHMYYAFSPQPIRFWHRGDSLTLPKTPVDFVDMRNCFCATDNPEADSCVQRDEVKRKAKALLGSRIQMLGYPTESSRTPPFWGSGFLETNTMRPYKHITLASISPHCPTDVSCGPEPFEEKPVSSCRRSKKYSRYSSSSNCKDS